ncbi:MAG: type II toxin-antitoxin system RelB/DinJ family antitoxin [Streptococcaceae bacterium]|jgi:DNA-damage-inducible protein J|nr:type II toxin-antitoxin system RelB/DinJ family antitoxin [Streptococcaceae bacterium]
MAEKMISITVPKSEKDQADALFRSMGMTTTTAVRMFLKQSIMNGGLPFQPERFRGKKGVYGQHKKSTVTKIVVNENGEWSLPKDAPDELKEWVENG